MSMGLFLILFLIWFVFLFIYPKRALIIGAVVVGVILIAYGGMMFLSYSY